MRSFRITPGLKIAQAACAALALMAGVATADDVSTPSAADRQSLDDAWWTGPIVTAGAAPVPQGHWLVEPYIYDAVTYGHYDKGGTRRDAAKVNSFGSLTYILYGLTDRLTVGLIPTFGFNAVSGGSDSSGIGIGDLTFQAQYGLTQFREGSRVPTTSLVFQQSFPTGKYDRLGTRPGDGLGSGAWTTTLALHSQYYFWLPNGRILRTRLNLAHSFSDDVSIRDVSVYGTDAGFRGHARRGRSFAIYSSWEYSMTRNWVLALDVAYEHFDSTRVSGRSEDVSIAQASGSGRRLGLTPAIEYSWNSRMGVIVGARWFADGRNTDASITPVVAINMVY